MKKIRTYLKSEDAYLAASLLGSNGIDAVVIDDSAFGGNLLGTLQKNAIRIEVEEDCYDEADEILILAEAQQRGEPEKAPAFDPGVEKKRSGFFDFLVIAEVALILLFALVPARFYPDAGPQATEFAASQVVSDDLWGLIHDLYPGYLFVCLLSSALLLMRLRIGRILFSGAASYGLLSSLFLPAVMVSPLGSAAEGLSWMLTGAVLLSIWTPPVSGEFRKRIDD